ncbi:tripartite tricarboxylate transporter TctB family protein [Chelativorans xinjiangense]|uniref:tripartite tricarboxylate transporter TctB family protein n=1 Tax=Chelativorans xinjiangense TaxID=2681485 RepID=UPI001359185E|nr:tripartite tricarboxylate transporter TctB family protein [Chelativorans xinjiangense]
MKIYEQAGGMFWLFFAALVMAESMRLGLGTPANPGAGFVTFVSALCLGFLSLAHIARTTFQGAEAADDAALPLAAVPRVLPSFIALVLYALVLPLLGYGLSTFALMFVLFWLVQPKRYVLITLLAFISTALTQLIFQFLLKSQFPVGPWGF